MLNIAFPILKVFQAQTSLAPSTFDVAWFGWHVVFDVFQHKIHINHIIKKPSPTPMYVCLAINNRTRGESNECTPRTFLFSQIRTTFFWLCLNAVDQANMGFMTVEGQSPCSTACGSKNYSAGQSHMY